MKYLIMFFLNFLVAIIFGWDMMDYYIHDGLNGLNIINNDVNRVFIIWLGVITSLSSSMYFLEQHMKNLRNRKL